MSNEKQGLDLSDGDRKAVEELQAAWKDVADSLRCQPVIYDKDDNTGEVKAVWLGEWISGSDATTKADAICKAKMEEFDRIGPKAFEDTLPLKNALKPGESRFV